MQLTATQPSRRDNQNVINILKTRPTGTRTKEELSLIKDAISDVTFFQKILLELGDLGIEQCCQYMSYVFLSAGTLVFKKGQVGNQFYIILSGQVSVVLILENNSGQIEETEISQIKSGQSFGELALITDEPRTATVKCKKDCNFAVFIKKDYNKILGKLQYQEVKKKIEFLRSVTLLKRLPYRVISTLIYHFESHYYQRGQVIYRENEQPNQVYLVKSGGFALSKKIGLNISNIRLSDDYQQRKQQVKHRELQVCQLGVGEMFGEIECYLEQARVFKATCVSYESEMYNNIMNYDISKDFMTRLVQHQSMHVKDYFTRYIKEVIERRNQQVDELIFNVQAQKSLYKGYLQSQPILEPEQDIQQTNKQHEEGQNQIQNWNADVDQNFNIQQNLSQNEISHSPKNIQLKQPSYRYYHVKKVPTQRLKKNRNKEDIGYIGSKKLDNQPQRFVKIQNLSSNRQQAKSYIDKNQAPYSIAFDFDFSIRPDMIKSKFRRKKNLSTDKQITQIESPNYRNQSQLVSLSSQSPKQKFNIRIAKEFQEIRNYCNDQLLINSDRFNEANNQGHLPTIEFPITDQEITQTQKNKKAYGSQDPLILGDMMRKDKNISKDREKLISLKIDKPTLRKNRYQYN